VNGTINENAKDGLALASSTAALNGSKVQNNKGTGILMDPASVVTCVSTTVSGNAQNFSNGVKC
ncbi:hypothetical protein HY009_02435, partial [Candidatus Acetothermia bacterium]|nr:hypothetical protein [Candidatus Acetothermia bacterium]